MESEEESHKKTYLFLALLYPAVLAGVILFIDHAQKRDLELYLQKAEREELLHYKGVIATYGKVATMSASEVFASSEVASMLAEALDHPSKRNEIRKALYEKLKESYRRLSAMNFRQVHFHFPDGVSFLRMHLPSRFGDDLLPVRPSVKKVNELLKPIQGFEIGKHYHAYRFLFPIFHEGRHVGNVGIGIPFYVISKALAEIDGGVHLLLVKGDLVKAKLEEGFQDKYRDVSWLPGMVMETADADAVGDDDALAIPMKLAKELAEIFSGEAHRPAALQVRHDGRHYVVFVQPVENIERRVAAYHVSWQAAPLLGVWKGMHRIVKVVAAAVITFLFLAFLMAVRKTGYKYRFVSALLDGLPNPVWLEDGEGNIISANSSFYPRVMEKIGVAKKREHLVGGPDAEELARACREVVTTRLPTARELILSFRRGKPRHYLVHLTPFPGAGGYRGGVLCSAHDVSNLKETEAKLQRAMMELDQVFNTAADPMRIIDLEGNILKCNRAFARLAGMEPESLVGKKCHEVFKGASCHTPGCPIERAKEGQKAIEGEVEKTLPGGKRLVVLVNATPFLDEKGRLVGIVEDFQDITRFREMEEQLREMAVTDRLTGLKNRRGFMEEADLLMKQAARSGKDLALIFLDLDNLKEINDELGHEAGDRAIVRTARFLESLFRESDVIARVGGDEFAVIGLCEPGSQCVSAIERRIEEAVALERERDTGPYPFSISFGVAIWNKREDLDSFLSRADALMYRYKRKKKGAG